MYFTISYGYGVDVSVGGYGSKYYSTVNEPITATNIEGFALFHSTSIGNYDMRVNYSLTRRPGSIFPDQIGNTIGVAGGLSAGPTLPLIVNGAGGISYTFNLTKIFKQ